MSLSIKKKKRKKYVYCPISCRLPFLFFHLHNIDNADTLIMEELLHPWNKVFKLTANCSAIYTTVAACLFCMGCNGQVTVVFLTYWHKNVCSDILCCNCMIEEEKLKRRRRRNPPPPPPPPTLLLLMLNLTFLWCVFVGEIQKSDGFGYTLSWSW